MRLGCFFFFILTTMWAQAPLTERERMMLDRIEKLEQRLAVLEGKPAMAPGVAMAAASAPAVRAEVSPTIAAVAPGASGAVSAGPGVAPAASKEPFAFADFTWLTGNPRTTESPLDTKYFTPEVRVDVNYTQSFNQPKDNTIGGSSEIFRSGEVQLTQLGLGGDFHYENVRARVMTQIGMYSQATPKSDASVARGQWGLDNAYRYVSEANAGYHFNKLRGINVDAGLFVSYVGMFSYYQFDNWAYQSSYVSSNTPWVFTGVRVQIFPSEKLKIEPWFVNGWQSYGKFNKAPGVGGQVMYRPNGSLSFVFNNYWGSDTLGNPDRKRVHTDDSMQVKYLDRPKSRLSKAAFNVAINAGCEYGGGVSCTGARGRPAQYFLGFMAYNRLWFHRDRFAWTLGGGAITNPGRYLVLIPPINGAGAVSGTPYFTGNPGDKFRAWDASSTFDYMPSQFFTWRLEFNHRAANVPYFSGAGGLTPPGGNTGPFGSFVQGWSPDLRKYENRLTIALLLKL